MADFEMLNKDFEYKTLNETQKTNEIEEIKNAYNYLEENLLNMTNAVGIYEDESKRLKDDNELVKGRLEGALELNQEYENLIMEKDEIINTTKNEIENILKVKDQITDVFEQNKTYQVTIDELTKENQQLKIYKQELDAYKDRYVEMSKIMDDSNNLLSKMKFENEQLKDNLLAQTEQIESLEIENEGFKMMTLEYEKSESER